MRKWRDEGTRECRGQELYMLELCKIHIGLSRKLSSPVAKMRTGKIGRWKFIFHHKVLGIEDRICERR